MSQITENTVIIEKADYEKFNEAIESLIDDGVISGVHNSLDQNLKFTNGHEYVIYTFDCNGDGELVFDDYPNAFSLIYMIETNYLDGDEYWTQKLVEDDYLDDIDETCEKFLKRVMTKDEFSKIKRMIKYSVEKESKDVEKEI